MIDCNITTNYLAEKARMSKTTKSGICKVGCAKCPLSAGNNNKGICCSEKAIAIVQKWSDKHPPKTYFSELLKHYPNTSLDDNGIPNFCPYRLGLMSIDDCRKDLNCAKCWNHSLPIKDGEE